MLTSTHGMAIAHTNSQQLCLPMQDLCKIKPAKIPAWLEKDSTALPLAEELLVVGSY